MAVVTTPVQHTYLRVWCYFPVLITAVFIFLALIHFEDDASHSAQDCSGGRNHATDDAYDPSYVQGAYCPHRWWHMIIAKEVWGRKFGGESGVV